ncbi:MAG TPA: urate hydroxylase PuuD [Thermoanaerobaculia bacterium]|nr:urate hydroxylase PuuD [Thermoanaerobaculia bacterium]
MTWPQDWQTNVTFLLRWGHFLAGITWIGMLYFFNLVNVNFMKELDAATKGKVVPNLMPKALYWFRWGAFWTVATGLVYYMLILHTEANVGRTLAVVLIGWIVAWLIVAVLLRMAAAGGALKDGRALGVVIAVVVAATAWAVLSFIRDGGSNRSMAIGIGGGMGIVMFMNVWMIIWPLQQKIIAATRATAESGTPAPPDMPKWARRAFLASRTNTWLSVPMLFFMGAASHFPIFARLGGG